jgi:outer membrane receptor protein involved in Fe transport
MNVTPGAFVASCIVTMHSDLLLRPSASALRCARCAEHAPSTIRHFVVAALSLLSAAGWADAAADTLEEVVVTAQRQEVPRLATPLSIDRIGADAIDLVGATHSSEILNRVPGTMIQRGSGEESLTAIRSPVLTGAGSCGAFLFLESGIPIRPTGFCNVNEVLEINTEQADAIEVIRGTGSALYGSNAMHGVVNVLQDQPASLPPAAASLMYGPDEYLRVGAEAARSTDPGLGLKALYTHDGGWRASSGFDEGKLNATLATDSGSALPGRFDLAATTLDQQTAGFVYGKNAYRDVHLIETNPNPEAYRKADAVRLTGLLQPDTSLPGQLELRPYARYSRMDFLQHFLPGEPVERNGQESVGLISTIDWSMPSRATLTTGIDLEWADSYLQETQDQPTIGNRPTGKHYDYTVVSHVVAGYGQGEYEVTPTVHLGAGVRVEYVTYAYDNRMLAGNTDANGVPCPGGCLFNRPPDRNDSFTNAAPKLTVRWNPNDAWLLYANASRGFRPPEMTEMYRLQKTQSVADLQSEQIDALEAGLKLSLADWYVELAGYDMRKEHVILRDSNGYNVSDGRTTHRGVEYDVRWQAVSTLAATVSGTYAVHKYDFSKAVDAGETITRGNDIDTAPRELLRAALDYSPLASLNVEAEWLVVGAYWADAANLHRYPGHELLNLRGRWQVNPAWAATLRVDNALDRRYADRADYAFGDYRYFPGRPRAVFAELDWTLH